MALHFSMTCAHCGQPFDAGHATAVTCSVGCRNRRHRARMATRRARLAAEADRAIASGDIVELTRVARATAALLAA